MGYPGFMLLIYGICVSNLFWHKYGFRIRRSLFSTDQGVTGYVRFLLANFNLISKTPLGDKAELSDEEAELSDEEAEPSDEGAEPSDEE